MRLPKWTLLVFILATVIFFVPPLKNTLIYDRESIIAGQWWRLITGNLVHFSTMHFIYDAIALLIIGMLIELRGFRNVWLIYVISSAIIGVVVFISSPELRFFGGLSGMVTAILVYLCLWQCQESGIWRAFYLSILALVVVKIGMEFMFGLSLISTSQPQPFIPSPVSHLAGAVTGLLVFLSLWLRFRLIEKSSSTDLEEASCGSSG